MFCPACRSEYVEGVTSCADCLVDLVAELPPEEGEGGLAGEPMEIYRCDEPEAEIIRSLLEAYGVPAMFGPGHVAGGYNLTAGASGEVGIVVGEADADLARALIASGLRGDLALDAPLSPPVEVGEVGDVGDNDNDNDKGGDGE